MKINKKILPKYFQAIVDGRKNYELRLADWECNEGDVLVLQEWDQKTKSYTGREIEKEISYVGKFKMDDLIWSEDDIKRHGLQILALK